MGVFFGLFIRIYDYFIIYLVEILFKTKYNFTLLLHPAFQHRHELRFGEDGNAELLCLLPF